MPVDPVASAFATPASTIVGLTRTMELALEEVGLSSSQYRLLAFCSLAPTTPSEVAVWLSVQKQSVTRQLDTLVRGGYLDRTPDPLDRRRAVHTVTEHGREVLVEAERVIGVYLEVVLATLGSRDEVTARRGLVTIGTALTRVWHQAQNWESHRPLTGWADRYAQTEGDATHRGDDEPAPGAQGT